MDLQEIISDKQRKTKEKTELLSQQLLTSGTRITELIALAISLKDPAKATCIEAIEHATKIKPGIADINCLEFVTQTLTAKAPRIKWESARVIGNIAHLFPRDLDLPISNLLANSSHSGTVVRWSAAFALAQIVQLNTDLNQTLIPEIEAIIDKEEKNSIRKIYQDALKKARNKKD